MTEHVSQQELALYTLGGVDPVRAGAIESHVEACASCAESLQREARVDVALHELADHPPCPGCARTIEHDRCTFCGAAARVGEYRVREVRVQNQHGRLYLAETASGDQVALKELCFNQAPSFEALDAFDREARILCALKHPALPRYISSFQAGEGVQTRLYLAQEFIEGQSLEERLATHYYTEAEIVFVARQVLEILVFLQSKSPMVIHRDIKPANLIMRPDGKIVLVDFGAARDQGSTAGATQVGTFGFMPIEQLAGLVDATTDVYALGVSLLRLLTRREPWKLLDDPWKHSNVSPELRRVIRRMIARKPEDRYPNAAAALAEIQGIALGSRRRRVPPWALGVSAAVAIGVGAVAVSVLATPRPEKPSLPAPAPQPPPLTPGEVEAKATSSSGTALECFAAAEQAADASYLAGVTKLRVGLTVTPDGRVSSVELSEGSPTLRACLASMVGGWRFRPNPGGQYGFVLARPDAVAAETCDEVSCVLNNYEGACCRQYRPPRRVESEDPPPETTGNATCDEVSCVISNYEGECCTKYRKGPKRVERDADGNEIPASLDRTMIAAAVNPIKARVMFCGDKTKATGLVKVSVKVKPDGTIAEVTVKQTPDPALGACVAAAMARARFARTLDGGAFSYPFVF